MNSAFAQIIFGQDRSFCILENESFVAVLEKNPLVLGHVVLISKIFKDDLFDLPDEDLARALVFAKLISRGIRNVIPCQKVGLAVLGLETRHAHLHLVPISSADDLNFTRPKIAATDEILRDLTLKIRAALATEHSAKSDTLSE